MVCVVVVVVFIVLVHRRLFRRRRRREVTTTRRFSEKKKAINSVCVCVCPSGLDHIMGQTQVVVDSDTEMKADRQATRSGRELAGSRPARLLALDAVD